MHNVFNYHGLLWKYEKYFLIASYLIKHHTLWIYMKCCVLGLQTSGPGPATEVQSESSMVSGRSEALSLAKTATSPLFWEKNTGRPAHTPPPRIRSPAEQPKQRRWTTGGRPATWSVFSVRGLYLESWRRSSPRQVLRVQLQCCRWTPAPHYRGTPQDSTDQATPNASSAAPPHSEAQDQSSTHSVHDPGSSV